MTMLADDKLAAAHLLRDAYIRRLQRDGITSRLSHWGEELLVPLPNSSERAKAYEVEAVEDFLAVLELLGFQVVDERDA